MPAVVKKKGPHERLPWRSSDPDEIFVHSRYDRLKGTHGRKRAEAEKAHAHYLRAKTEFDQDMADELVYQLISRPVIEKLVDTVVDRGLEPRVVLPHPEFDADHIYPQNLNIKNAIPHAMAAYIASELDCEIDTEIIETARPGRSKLNSFQRFLWQPSFAGRVRNDVGYVLVDDVCTLGGTLAALRNHIVCNGGTVVAVTSLCNQQGKGCKFGIDDHTNDMLYSLYTKEISQFWLENIGHDTICLTQAEGDFLVRWARQANSGRGTGTFQRLRDKISETAAR